MTQGHRECIQILLLLCKACPLMFAWSLQRNLVNSFFQPSWRCFESCQIRAMFSSPLHTRRLALSTRVQNMNISQADGFIGSRRKLVDMLLQYVRVQTFSFLVLLNCFRCDRFRNLISNYVPNLSILFRQTFFFVKPAAWHASPGLSFSKNC